MSNRLIFTACFLLGIAEFALCDSIGTLVSGSAQTTYNLNYLEIGHPCSSGTLGTATDAEWWTPGDCIVNLDTLQISAVGNSDVNCTLSYKNVFQTDPNTGRDMWFGTSTFVGVENYNLCVLQAVTMVGGSLPAAAVQSCPVCTSSQNAVRRSVETITNIGSVDLSVTLYSSIYTDSCYTNSISQGTPNAGTYYGGGNGADCTSPIAMIELTADTYQGCNVTITPAVPHILNMFAGVEGEEVCVDAPAVVSLQSPIVVTYSGACPKCTKL